jgi:hydroxymethylbilane synthase
VTSTPTRRVRVGSRGSALAMVQAQLVIDAITGTGRDCELVMIETDGDRRLPDTAWGEGAFVKAIERALLDRRIDAAAHSAKDIPTDEDPRLAICAYLPREAPLDVLVLADGDKSSGLAELPAGAVVGTDSPRRTGFVRWHRPDVEVRPLSGNVDTRLRRLDSGEVDALVLAAAGLHRLGLASRISQELTAAQIPPAPGQGAIAVQVRSDDDELIELCTAIDDTATRRAVETERAFLRAAGGGCRAPIGALALMSDGLLQLVGGFASPDGRRATLGELTGSATDGASVATQLVVELSRRHADAAGARRVLLTRPATQASALLAQLALAGIVGVEVPAIEIVPADSDRALDRALGEFSGGRVIVTSVNGVRAATVAAARLGANLADYHWAAVGQATAAALRMAGARSIWRPSSAHGRAVGEELPLSPGDRLLLARGDLADGALPTILRRRGAAVVDVIAYRTIEAPSTSRPLLEAALAGPLDAVIFASPSAVRGLLTLAGADLAEQARRLPAICIGASTSAAAHEAGFAVAGQPSTPDAAALAELAGRLLGQQASVPA